MLVQAGQVLEQRLNEGIAEFAGRPMLELAEVENVSNDSEMSEYIGPNVDVGANNFHCCNPVVAYSGDAVLLAVSNRPPDTSMCNLTPMRLTGCPRRALCIEE